MGLKVGDVIEFNRMFMKEDVAMTAFGYRTIKRAISLGLAI